MALFTAIQTGTAKDGAQFGNASPGTPGVDYPDFANGGDRLDDGGFDLTDVDGILGDDSASPALVKSGGTITASGNLRLQSTGAHIECNGGELDMNGHELSFAPNANGSTVLTMVGNTTTITCQNAQMYFDSSRGATSMEGINTGPGDAVHPGFIIVYLDGSDFHGFGNGDSLDGLYWAARTGDRLRWHGGSYYDCGRYVPNCGPQGFSVDYDIDIDGVFFGFWRGTFAASGRDDQPISLRNLFNTSPTNPMRHTNCAFYHDSVADNYTLNPVFAGPGPMTFAGSRLLGYGMSASQSNVNLDDVMKIFTEHNADVNDMTLGLQAGGGQSAARMMFVGALNSTQGPHLPIITGDAATTSFPAVDWILDGCGKVYSGDAGDQPIIVDQHVEFTRLLMIHGAGGINPSLLNNGGAKISINRFTMHDAEPIITGEAEGHATMLQSIKNGLVSAPRQGALIIDGGGNLVNQTEDAIDYIAFNQVQMNGANQTHGTLGGAGYVGSDAAGSDIAEGANDQITADFQFADSARNGYTWALSLGYTADSDGLRAAILAGYGWDSAGNPVAVDPDATPANYRSYVLGGYTSSNPAFAGAGEGGVDLGVADISIPLEVSGVTASVQAGGTLTITGTELDTVTSLTIGGEDRFADIATQAETEITLPVNLGGLPYGVTTVEVGNGLTSDSDTFDFQPVAGNWEVDVVAPSTGTDSIAYQHPGAAPATDDQAEISNPNSLSNLVVNADLTFSADDAGDFQARIWDATDSTWGAWATITIEDADVNVPVITLEGGNPITLEGGTPYSEPGYTATDAEDGDLTGSVVVGGDVVDHTTAGAYQITYDVQDAAGNPAVQRVRTVNVVDTTAPAISLLGDNPLHLDLGVAYSEPGYTASDLVDGDLTGSVVVGGDVVDHNVEGVYVLTYNVQDAAGNSAFQVTRTVLVGNAVLPSAIGLVRDVVRGIENDLTREVQG